MTPEQNTGMEVPKVDMPVPEGMIEMPLVVAEQNEAMRADDEAARAAAQDGARAEAAAVAQSINDTRPEGMSSTLPTGPAPASQELTASTVRSGTGIRIDGAPQQGPVQPAAQEVVTPQQ